MQALQPQTVRAASLCPAPLAPRARQQPAGARLATQKQALAPSGNVIAQRRGLRAAGRVAVAAGSVVARAGGDVLVVGSSGQTAARVVVSLLRTGFKVTAGGWLVARNRPCLLRCMCDVGWFTAAPALVPSRPASPAAPAAGVDTDLDESQQVVKFAKQLELLSKGEAGALKVRRPAARAALRTSPLRRGFPAAAPCQLTLLPPPASPHP